MRMSHGLQASADWDGGGWDPLTPSFRGQRPLTGRFICFICLVLFCFFGEADGDLPRIWKFMELQAWPNSQSPGGSTVRTLLIYSPWPCLYCRAAHINPLFMEAGQTRSQPWASLLMRFDFQSKLMHFCTKGNITLSKCERQWFVCNYRLVQCVCVCVQLLTSPWHGWNIAHHPECGTSSDRRMIDFQDQGEKLCRCVLRYRQTSKPGGVC